MASHTNDRLLRLCVNNQKAQITSSVSIVGRFSFRLFMTCSCIAHLTLIRFNINIYWLVVFRFVSFRFISSFLRSSILVGFRAQTSEWQQLRSEPTNTLIFMFYFISSTFDYVIWELADWFRTQIPYHFGQIEPPFRATVADLFKRINKNILIVWAKNGGI